MIYDGEKDEVSRFTSQDFTQYNFSISSLQWKPDILQITLSIILVVLFNLSITAG